MEYKRSKYLIQHRENKQFIKISISHDETLELTPNAWSAWGWNSAQDALYDLETNRYMPVDKDAYRIVKTIDQREVEEDERLQTSVQQGME